MHRAVQRGACGLPGLFPARRSGVGLGVKQSRINCVHKESARVCWNGCSQGWRYLDFIEAKAHPYQRFQDLKY